MKLFHQTGFRWKWNLDSLLQDGAGTGLILSPVDITRTEMLDLPAEVRAASFFDPQIYVPGHLKRHLSTYSYFPSYLQEDFETVNFDDVAIVTAQECINLQNVDDLAYIVIPTRYFDALPSNYFQQLNAHYVEPFLEHFSTLDVNKPLLLTVIVKPVQLTDSSLRKELLNWITGIQTIAGIYLIFENIGITKQIKDPTYLANALEFIHILRLNDMEVHIGYANTEGILYSVAQPTSISMGAYENLRHFNIKRFEEPTEGTQRGPTARFYCPVLLQWMNYQYLDSLKKLYGKWQDLISQSPYNPLLFEPSFNWNFQKPEPYKHFFVAYNAQINSLLEGETERLEQVRLWVAEARQRFAEIEESGVALDSESDGSHLAAWFTALSVYKKYLESP